jgi:FkbM family methyltransferase
METSKVNRAELRDAVQSSAIEELKLAVSAKPPHKSKRNVSRLLRFLGRITDYSRELGPALGLRWYCLKLLARLSVPGARRIRIKPPDLAHPITVRMFPSSDDFVFDQLFVRHEYGPVCSRLSEAKFILDLGANVGYASALFATRYPLARILAVEPDPGNYKVCVENLKPYGSRVETLLGAVWASRSKLALARGTFCDGREWATQVVEARKGAEANVEAWDVPSLLDLAGQDVADLIKIDIEGSEAEVFASNASQWLPRVRNICIELHDERCRDIFFHALRGYRYNLLEFEEFTFCLDLRRAR